MKLSSGVSSREAVESAAKLRGNHAVLKRLDIALKSKVDFCYHVKGSCYKTFTKKGTRDNLKIVGFCLLG